MLGFNTQHTAGARAIFLLQILRSRTEQLKPGSIEIKPPNGLIRDYREVAVNQLNQFVFLFFSGLVQRKTLSNNLY